MEEQHVIKSSLVGQKKRILFLCKQYNVAHIKSQKITRNNYCLQLELCKITDYKTYFLKENNVSTNLQQITKQPN